MNSLLTGRAVSHPDRLAALDAQAILDMPAEPGFDDVVRLATRLCSVPVALVSLVSRERQWFKARVDLYGTALVLEALGAVMARGGAGVVIAFQSDHRLPPLNAEQNAALATTPAEELLALPMLQPDQVKDPLPAY